MKWPWRKQTPSPELAELEKSLHETKILIAQAYTGFNSAADPELVESYIYEIQSLQSRYSYLLRQRKALGETPAGGRRESRRAAAKSPRTAPGQTRAVLPVT